MICYNIASFNEECVNVYHQMDKKLKAIASDLNYIKRVVIRWKQVSIQTSQIVAMYKTE